MCILEIHSRAVKSNAREKGKRASTSNALTRLPKQGGDVDRTDDEKYINRPNHKVITNVKQYAKCG